LRGLRWGRWRFGSRRFEWGGDGSRVLVMNELSDSFVRFFLLRYPGSGLRSV
jgi:hypothetical protein